MRRTVEADGSLVSSKEWPCLWFSPDGTRLAVGRNGSFDVFTCSPFACLSSVECGGNVYFVEMMLQSDVVAVGRYCGSCSALEDYSPQNSAPKFVCDCRRRLTVEFWDISKKCMLFFLSMPEAISTVKMNKYRLVVLLTTEIRILDLKSLQLLQTIRRTFRDLPDCSSAVAMCPNGYLAVTSSSSSSGWLTILDTHSLSSLGSVNAHNARLQVMAFNASGTLLASASVKGTIVRVWSVPTLDKVFNFRRGASECTLYSLTFSLPSGQFLVSAGASNTVHVFRCHDGDLKTPTTGTSCLSIPPVESHSCPPVVRARGEDYSEAVGDASQSNVAFHCQHHDISDAGGVTVSSDTGINTQQAQSCQDLSHRRPISPGGPRFTTFDAHNSAPSRLASSLTKFGNLALSSLSPYMPESYRDLVDSTRCFSNLRLQRQNHTASEWQYRGILQAQLTSAVIVEKSSSLPHMPRRVSTAAASSGGRRQLYDTPSPPHDDDPYAEVLVACSITSCLYVYVMDVRTGLCRLRAEQQLCRATESS